MQAALEAGQLNRVADMLGILPTDIVTEDKSVFLETDGNMDSDRPSDGKNWDDLYYDDWFNEDSLWKQKPSLYFKRGLCSFSDRN